MQSQSMLDEVDAIKKQLKLLGHNVPTDVIITFLENNNQLVPSHTPAEVPRAPLQPFAVHRDVQRSYRTTQTGYLRQAVPQQPVSAQTGARPPPQLDTAWAGVNAAVSSTGAYEQAMQPWWRDTNSLHDENADTDCNKASTVRQDALDQATCQPDSGASKNHAPHQRHVPNFISAETRPFMDYEDEYTALKRTLEELNASLDDHQPVSHSQPLSQTHKALTDPAPTDTSSKRSSDMPNNRQPMHQTDRRQSLPDFQPLSQMDAAQTDSAQPDQNPADESHDDKYWYKQDAAMFRDSSPGQVHPSAEMQKEPSYARSHRSQHTDRRHKPAPSVLGSMSLRNLPVLNNSFIVPAQAVKPKKVDRVNRHKELQQAWSKDSFLKSGGTAKNSGRRSENFSELFSACHAAEDRLKDLTLKHSRAVKAVAPKTKLQQENIVPTAKRRDALRWETRMRMQIREDIL